MSDAGDKDGDDQAHGDPMRDTLARMYDAHGPWMYRYGLMLLADHGLAEDVVQQVFVKLVRRTGDPADIASPNGYLRRAVRNECYRLIARRQRTAGEVEQSRPVVESVSPGDQAESAEVLDAALRVLPAEQREVIHLKVYEDMTFAQIGELLSISPNTAASRYRYAIEKLQRLLEEDR